MLSTVAEGIEISLMYYVNSNKLLISVIASYKRSPCYLLLYFGIDLDLAEMLVSRYNT